jgi:hypothetical protein
LLEQERHVNRMAVEMDDQMTRRRVAVGNRW